MAERKASRSAGLHEQRMAQVRRLQLEQLMQGGGREVFAEWPIRGRLGVPIDPVAAVGIFPVVIDGKLRFDIHGLVVEEGEMEDYYREIARLEIPPGVISMEEVDFGDMPATGEDVMRFLVPDLSENALPTAAFVFSGTGKPVSEQAVYLLVHAAVPPSTAFAHARQFFPQPSS